MTMEHGFEQVRTQYVPELNSEARLYRHVRTGAELLSVINEDENKVFGVTFRTPPTDSTGLPHILEHSVLCGSRKFPSKEPFVELIKGSLNTFLNAMTYPDKTAYPVASQNLQDFYNLVDVYLDAVFFPRITPQVLQQEGWHYELESPDEPLRYKGVVFNEMKGANSSPERLLYQFSQQSLFPDTTYGVDSGGNPEAIPDLTYEQFRSFHERFYHPSNARFFFYGDDDPSERMRRLDDYLREFERAEVGSEVALQLPFDEPKRVARRYPVSEQEADARKAIVVVAWSLGEVLDPERALALQILDYILLGTPGSPLRQALIESGLGEDLAGYGVDDGRRQVMFSTGLKGTLEAHADEIESLILDTLGRLAREGIDPESIEAALNSVEFALRENNSGNYPRGLMVMGRALNLWLYGGDPITAIAFEQPLATIRARLATGEPLFETLIREGLLQNPHRATVLLQPDPALAHQLEEAERARLEAARAAMTREEIERVIEETRALRLAQETPDSPEALAAIPRLGLADLDRENKPIPLVEDEVAGTQLLFHDLPTNGILYLDLGMNLHGLPARLLPYVPLFGRALLEMGTEQEDYVRLSRRIDRKTGGIRPQTLATSVRGGERGSPWLFLRGKAMAPQAADLLEILRDVLLTVRLDNPTRFGQMVLEEKAGLEASLMPIGHRMVNRRLKAHFNEADWVNEQLTGVSQLFFLRALAERVQSDWAGVLADLEAVRQHLVSRPALLANVTVDGDDWGGVRPALAAFLNELPATPVAPVAWARELPPTPEGLAIPARVNYVGKAADLYRLGYELDGSALVVTRYLFTSWLWERVRVQGGAYGGFSAFDPLSGAFSFLSYRDPNLLATLEVYDRSAAFLRGVELGEEEVTKSIIGAISDFDAYQLPDAKGFTSMERYLAGMTDEARQRIREQILGTTAQSFRAFADVVDRVRANGLIVVMGAQEVLEGARGELDSALEIRKVL